MRCAIYFVPPPDDPLTVAAAAWIRRDPYSGAGVAASIDGLTDADHAFLTAIPRRYGFHATLKAPFHLLPSKSIHELQRWLGRFAAQMRPITLECRIDLVDSYFAIATARRNSDLDMLAAQIVTEFDGFRRPPGDEEIARRDVSRLSGQQLNNYLNWGSPNVFDQFRFHMTLTGPVPALERDHVRAVLERHFGALATGPLTIGQIVLAVEPEPHAPFLVHSAHHFRASSQLRIA